MPWGFCYDCANSRYGTCTLTGAASYSEAAKDNGCDSWDEDPDRARPAPKRTQAEIRDWQERLQASYGRRTRSAIRHDDEGPTEAEVVAIEGERRALVPLVLVAVSTFAAGVLMAGGW